MNPFIKNQKQLSIFVTAGFPEVDSLPKHISFLETYGIDFIEVGIPFSDPMADGSTIQESSDRALRNGINISMIFDQIKSTRTKTPLVIMSYFNPILHFGLTNFLHRCAEVGVRHLIIPDISLEIYEQFYLKQFEDAGVTLCFLITPDTEFRRIQKMSDYSKNGFLYLVSSSTTTGNQSQLSSIPKIETIRSACKQTPLMIGFGVRTREDVANVHKLADGAIIGSAFIRAVNSGSERDFISGLLVSEPQNL